jgi:hypothetical protein
VWSQNFETSTLAITGAPAMALGNGRLAAGAWMIFWQRPQLNFGRTCRRTVKRSGILCQHFRDIRFHLAQRPAVRSTAFHATLIQL